MATPLSFSHPTIEALTVQSTADSQQLQAIVDSILGRAWRVIAVSDLLGWFEVEYLESTALPLDQAWDAAYKLAGSPDVQLAEPAIDIAIADDEQTATETEAMELEEFGGGAAGPVYDNEDCDWSPRLVQAFDAWQLSENEGRPARGNGIRIAHPDTGYRIHSELGSNFLEPGENFVDEYIGARNPYGNHGLGTASVLSSPDNRQTRPRSVTGIAPEAEVVPLRVATRNGTHPAVLYRAGVRRLTRAITYVTGQSGGPAPFHVISISLGWVRNSCLHAAIQAAVKNNIIVVAAAGNYVGFVVAPANYPEVIAVAGCTSARKVWRWSSRGKAVQVTGPAQKVWKAVVKETNVGQGSGTSHATATTAGIAALWLAHHGRDALLERYSGGPSLAEVFCHCLQASSDPPPRDNGRWGAGIVNARRCLAAPLPEPGGALELFGAEPEPSGFNLFAEAYDDIEKEELRRRTAKVLNIDPAKVDHALHGLGPEWLARVTTDPDLRERLRQPAADMLEEFGENTQPPMLSSRFNDRLTHLR